MEVVMGISGFLNKRAHKEYLKRAMEHSWTAVNGIGMVFGPLSLALQSTQPDRDEVVRHITRWEDALMEVWNQNHMNLTRSGDEYGEWAGTNLAPLIASFQVGLEGIRPLITPTYQSPVRDGNEMIAEVVTLNSDIKHEFLEFHTLLEAKGREIGFDATKYEQKAIRKAQEFWKPTVTGLAGFSRFPD